MFKLGLSPWQFLFGLVALTLMGGPLVLAAPLSPSMTVDGSLVSWLPEAEYERAVLRVGGPTEDFTRTFLPGEVLSFDLAELDGPVDGLYTFELTVFLPQDEPGSTPASVAETVFLRAAEGRFLSFEPEEPAPAFPAGDPSGEGEDLRHLSAELAFNEDLSVIGRACIGPGCTANEAFGSGALRLKGDVLRLEFDDTDSPLFPNNDWQLTLNDSGFGSVNRFSIDDVTSFTTPFTLLAGAPDHSLFVDSDGEVGLGTAVPDSPLHVWRTDGTAKLTVEEIASTAQGRILLDLINHGAVRFQLTDTSQGQTWRLANGGSLFRIVDTSDLHVVEFALNKDGDLTIGGEIFTRGTCRFGCDRVFEDDYDLESIEEHAELMWANSHLPGVGPTPESGQVNLSQKTLGILNELEKAHIYIDQLHQTLQEVQAAMARQTAELEALEQVVHGLAGARSRP